jgi:hypothetical protein
MRQSEEMGIAAATEALDEIDRLESRLTVFRETSEVSVVNSEAAKRSIEVSQELVRFVDVMPTSSMKRPTAHLMSPQDHLLGVGDFSDDKVSCRRKMKSIKRCASWVRISCF